MAADGQTTISPATEWTYRSDADRQRAVEMLLRDPLWSLLDDEAIASIAEVSPDMVRDHRRLRDLGRRRAMRERVGANGLDGGCPSEPGGLKETVMSGDILAWPLSHLGLNIRATNALLVNGISTVGDLLAKTETELMRLPLIGLSNVREIKAKLSARGLALRPEP